MPAIGRWRFGDGVMRLLTFALITLVLFASVPAQAQSWVDVFDPFRMLDLNLEMSPADWDTIRRDTTFMRWPRERASIRGATMLVLRPGHGSSSTASTSAFT
jgi:hypothetical protein